MKGYDKIISSITSLSSIRMLIGATSTIYMLDSGVELYQIGIIKSMQAVVILLFGFFIGVISDRINRKYIHILAIFISFSWLFLFYLGGIYSSIFIFYIAEILNGISLCMMQNNTNGYLVEQFKEESKEDKLDGIFGKLSKWVFLGMAISSLIGGVSYYLFEEDSFLYTSLLMLALFICSIFYLPNGNVTFKASKKWLDKNEFHLIVKKFKKHKKSISAYILYGLLFQVIIQYWQVMVYDFDVINKNNYWLGLILCLLMLSQSAAGQIAEKIATIPKILLYVSTILVLFMLIASITFSAPIIYIIGLCIIMFSVRYISILVGAELQSDLKNRFRAKYDMILNSLLRIITAITLFIVGFLVDKFGAEIILYLGIILITINILIELFIIPKTKV